MSTDIKTFFDEHTKKVSQLEAQSHDAYWNLAVSGDESHAKKLADYTFELRKLYSSNEDFEFLCSQREQKDPLLKRQIELEIKNYQQNQTAIELLRRITTLETEIESIYTNFRAELNNKEVSSNEIKTILGKSQDLEERKKAWEASKLIGENIDSKVRELILLRNESARIAGFKDFYSMSLELQELDQERLFNQLKELEELTNADWAQYKDKLNRTLGQKFNVSPQDIKPWHFIDPFFQDAPPQDIDLDSYYAKQDVLQISKKFYAEVGLPVDDILSRSDLYERAKKNQHAFCMNINRAEDIRILCNLRNTEYWMMVQLHELGHAVYYKYINQNLPYFLRTHAHINTTEASAMLFGRLSIEGEFLKRFCGVVNTNVLEKAKEEYAAKLLVFARWCLVIIHFERAMYQAPHANLNKLWWDLVSKYQGVSFSRDKPDWAAKSHLACNPVYYQNYIIGEMTASQLIHALKKESGAKWFLSKKSGDFLRKNLYDSGATYPWEETLERATGEKLNPTYFANDCR
jgi:peptidyl-dipeptidase A